MYFSESACVFSSTYTTFVSNCFVTKHIFFKSVRVHFSLCSLQMLMDINSIKAYCDLGLGQMCNRHEHVKVSTKAAAPSLLQKVSPESTPTTQLLQSRPV